VIKHTLRYEATANAAQWTNCYVTMCDDVQIQDEPHLKVHLTRADAPQSRKRARRDSPEKEDTD
jgi:hypothetical protein